MPRKHSCMHLHLQHATRADTFGLDQLGTQLPCNFHLVVPLLEGCTCTEHGIRILQGLLHRLYQNRDFFLSILPNILSVVDMTST